MPNDPKLKIPYRQNGFQKFVMLLMVLLIFVALTAVFDDRPPDFWLVGQSLLVLYVIWWLGGRIVGWMHEGPDRLAGTVRSGASGAGQGMAADAMRGELLRPLLKGLGVGLIGALAIYLAAHPLGLAPPRQRPAWDAATIVVAAGPVLIVLALWIAGDVLRRVRADPGEGNRPARDAFSFDAGRFHGFRSRGSGDKRPIFKPLMIEHKVDLSSDADANAFAEGLRRSMDEELRRRMEEESGNPALSPAEQAFLRQVLAALRGKKAGEPKQIEDRTVRKIAGP